MNVKHLPIKVGDMVEVIGKTINGASEEEQLIKIGTVCNVVATEQTKEGLIVGLVPIERPYDCEYWYLEKDVKKGHFEWIRED